MQPPLGRDPETNQAVPVPNVVPVERMAGDDDEDTALLQQMLEDAKSYILSFSWCESVVGSYFGGGVGRIFAVFLFNISPARADVGEWIWIIVGDIPRAYLPLEDCKSSKEVFDAYIAGMKRGVALAREGGEGTPEDGVPPLNIPATPEEAEILERRLWSLTEWIKPFFD